MTILTETEKAALYGMLWPPARICRNLAGLKMLVVFETANMEFAGNHVMNKRNYSDPNEKKR